MATITQRRNGDGSTSFIAQVRVSGFRGTAKAFTARKDAKAWADAIETELREQRKRGGVREDVTTLTVAGVAKEFLEDPETMGLRYYDSLTLLIAWWVDHYGTSKVMELNVLTLREARDKLRPGRAAGTVNRYLSAMRSCWNWARSAGLIPADYAWPTRLMLTEPKGRTRYLDDDELARLTAASAAHSLVMHAAVVTSLACGVRQSELLRLKWADVDFDRKRVRVLLSKNDDARAIHLPDSAATVLKALKNSRVVGQQVFTKTDGTELGKNELEHRWRSIRSTAALENFRWHDLRHSCASFLAQNGASLLEIGGVLGHKSPSVTQRYSHLVEGAAVTGHDALDKKLTRKEP